jgi:hypothetical protein
MHDFDRPGENESLTALLTLSDPAVLSSEQDAQSILFHYPAAKLGLRSGIRFCAGKLVEAVRNLHRDGLSSQPWVVASPPRFVLPGAANLMARELTQLLGTAWDLAPTLAELWLATAAEHIEVEDSPGLYAQAAFAARIKERSRLHQRLKPLAVAQFQGRPVLFVNDIHVTGAQQHFMRQALQAAGVAHIHWLYLVIVPPEIGRDHPQIEYALNYSRHGSFDDFAELLRHADIEFTARCIHRLFDHAESELHAFLDSLPSERRQELIGLAAQEAQCEGRSAEYWAKLQRLSE